MAAAPYQESRPSQGKDQHTPDRPNHVAEPIVVSPVLTLRPTLSFRFCFLFRFSTTHEGDYVGFSLSNLFFP
jgi:hypothetical protein